MKKLANKVVVSLICFSLMLGQNGIVKADNVTGKAIEGWKQSGAIWNYLKADGTNTVGWIQNGGKWYYLDFNGAMVTGWKQEGTKWYYLNPNGDMAVSVTTPDGYVLGTDGAWDGGSVGTNGASDGKTTELSAKDINNKYSNSVVCLEVQDGNHKTISSGSGFIVDSNGIVVTNCHIIKGCEYANVTLKNGTKYEVKSVLNYNEKQDIAILQLSNATNLSTVKLGDSNTIETGDNVVAIGSPKGYEDTLSTGIISGINRKSDRGDDFQTIVGVIYGSSGAALFDMQGNVIGITYAGYDLAGNIGSIIPINEVKPFLNNRNEMTLMQLNNIQGGTVKFFPLLPDVPMPKYTNYYKVSLSPKADGTYIYCHHYSGASLLKNFFTDYYSLLEKNGWEVYTGSKLSFEKSFMVFKKGTNIISIGLSEGDANIIGYIQ